MRRASLGLPLRRHARTRRQPAKCRTERKTTPINQLIVNHGNTGAIKCGDWKSAIIGAERGDAAAAEPATRSIERPSATR